jgi:hypothetical protein
LPYQPPLIARSCHPQDVRRILDLIFRDTSRRLTPDDLAVDPFFQGVTVPDAPRIKLDSYCKGMIKKVMNANEMRRWVLAERSRARLSCQLYQIQSDNASMFETSF